MEKVANLDLSYSFFYHIIEDGSSVLFLCPKNVHYVLKFQEDKKCICKIFEDDFEKVNECVQKNIAVKFGSLNVDLLSIEQDTFDYVVCNDIITKVKFPVQFLKNLSRISGKILLGFDNFGLLRNRVRFLLSGSIFDSEYAGTEDFWERKNPWPYSYKDIRSIIAATQLIISKGVYLNKKGAIINIYDIKGYPNLLGYRFFLLLEKQSGLAIPKYVI